MSTTKRKYLSSWISRVKEFQSLPEDEQSKFCSYCGCTGGCNLCRDISKITDDEIINDEIINDISNERNFKGNRKNKKFL